MNSTHSSPSTQIKVGMFTVLGIGLIAIITVLVNNRPFWWRSCQHVKISVEDATGLKSKSPIRSLGIEIGYLESVNLTETHVALGICLTAPVEVLPSTRAYIRSEGFLGDKFVELKPVRYLGTASRLKIDKVLDWIIPQAMAAIPQAVPTPEPTIKRNLHPGREIPVGEEGQDIQHLVNRVDDLVQQMTGLTDNLKAAINPEDLRKTMRQLNQTLENASKTLSPESGLNQTARRTLAKLEDAIEQLRDQMTRVNKGEGSVGMLLNDPSYAEEIRSAIRNVNQLLNRVKDVRFVVDVGGVYMPAYSGGRGWFQLGIWPKKDRYYLIGIAMDPRGRISNTVVTTTVGGLSQRSETSQVDQTGILLTGMLGKVFFDRFDLAVGALYGDGAGSLTFRLGPNGSEESIQLRNDVYLRSSASSVDDRITLSVRPFSSLVLRAGLESFRPYAGQISYFVGAGLSFDDDDIKLLFSLK